MLLGGIAFIIWKMTRKRFSEFDTDGEEIKWPELNNESHALPTRATGRVGIDDDGYDDATTTVPSTYGGGAPGAASSMADLHPYNDPYAVPPLPQNNPNQPYRDDPSGHSEYYDPYRGPVPHSLHDPAGSSEGAESIPMSTYTGNYSNPTYGPRDGVRSPPIGVGRQSPGPGVAYGRQSPGPAAGYDGYRSQ